MEQIIKTEITNINNTTVSIFYKMLKFLKNKSTKNYKSMLVLIWELIRRLMNLKVLQII